MLFSIHTDQHIIDAKGVFGYSHGYYKMLEHFPKYKHKGKKLELGINEKASRVQMFYMEPEWYNLRSMTSFRAPDFRKFYNHQYKIYGTYLEATKVWSHWVDAMKQVDEIWVGNKFSAFAIENSGIKTPTYVFQLGIDKIWQPYMRGKKNKIRFLHVDSGSPRKRVDMAIEAFIEVFGENPDVELTLKYHDNQGNIEFSVSELFKKQYSNINKIYKTLSQEEMYQLYKDHDVLLYPSEGEGFGLIPLQALATGMPVISTSVWCDYEKYLHSNIIESKFGKTQHTGYFEGEVILPNFESFKDQIRKVYEDIDNQCKFFYDQAQAVIDEYDWQKKCNYILDGLIDRIGAAALDPIDEYIIKRKYVYFLGNNAYVTSGGARFDRDNRVHIVTEDEARGLLFNGNFRYATEQEIDNANFPTFP